MNERSYSVLYLCISIQETYPFKGESMRIKNCGSLDYKCLSDAYE